MGIAEDPDDGRTRSELREAIRIPQSARSLGSWHASIMPDSDAASPAFPPAARAGFRTLSPFFSPTHFHEDPSFINGDSREMRSSASVTYSGLCRAMYSRRASQYSLLRDFLSRRTRRSASANTVSGIEIAAFTPRV